MLLLYLLLLLPAPTRQAGDRGVTSLTVEEAVAQGVPLTFSPPTALSTLHAAHAASLAPRPQPPGGLQPHFPALRQIAQLCASAADLGARDSGPLYALLLGLAEGQARVQAQHAQLAQAALGAQGAPAPAPAPPPRAFLHSARWAGSGSGGGGGSGVGAAPASLLLPLGRALGVDVSVGAPGEGPWELPRAVDFLVLDGARSHGAVLQDLLALAPRAQKFLGLPHSELAPPDAGSGEGAAAQATGMALKAAVFDFLFIGNNSDWQVQAHFSNAGGFTLLGRKRP